MKNLQAQPATYKGIRFRSRLEVRWAMFFDQTHTPYQYEPRGFQFGDVWYLPDFYLPRQGLWVEIKGQTPNDLELHKAGMLTARTNEPVLLFPGKCWISTAGYCFVQPEREMLDAHAASPEHRRLCVIGETYLGTPYTHWCLCPQCAALAVYQRWGRRVICQVCEFILRDADDAFLEHPDLVNAFTVAYRAELWTSWYR